MKLLKGDDIIVTKGKNKGKSGKIEAVLPKKEMVLIQGVNQYKKHIKAKTPGQKSEIVTITKPLQVANVALVCPKCKKQTRVGYEYRDSGSKMRVCTKCRGQI